MRGRFYDGQSSRPHEIEAHVEDGKLVFNAGEDEHRWPLAGLEVDLHGGEARLASPRVRDARVVVDAREWRAADSGASRRSRERRDRAERRLLIGLVMAAAAVAAFVFIGMPILSGPLARNTPVDYERGMGQNFDLQAAYLFPDCAGLAGQAVLLELGKRIAAHADTEFDIAVRATHAPVTNAFALPGGPILLTDDLIREAESPDEVAAVIAHEIAHVEQRHVMQAVWRSLGVGLVLDAVVGGGTGAGQQAVLLHAAGLSSEGMAPFFERLAQEDRPRERAGRQAPELLATHPDVRRRAQAARSLQQPGAASLSDEEWATVRETCESPADEAIRRRRVGFPVDFNDAAPDQGDQVSQDGQAGGGP